MDKCELQITSKSIEETQFLGKRIGEHLSASTVIAMTGDLGSGKTCFVQGLARGLDVPDDCYVTSPTYTLINEYPGRLPLFHVDLYRLEHIDDIEDIGLYDIFNINSIIAIEWAERLHMSDLPEHLIVKIKISGDETRTISFSASGQLYYDLIQAIKNISKEMI
ncbi:MAG: tRNA (adenosine(37)-N6)-threonylcarbamoyltransferase complex ATPase subunit type 1 TsaE [Desulfobacterales bacterium]|nr:tRNA (adenosine(37)-N6)-threonylcarbamoyltransferase complex ATPase subunit type 1 TsaE [Desulfobacterales bacterium]